MDTGEIGPVKLTSKLSTEDTFGTVSINGIETTWRAWKTILGKWDILLRTAGRLLQKKTVDAAKDAIRTELNKENTRKKEKYEEG